MSEGPRERVALWRSIRACILHLNVKQIKTGTRAKERVPPSRRKRSILIASTCNLKASAAIFKRGERRNLLSTHTHTHTRLSPRSSRHKSPPDSIQLDFSGYFKTFAPDSQKLRG